ncbi:MAG: carbon-nitrogen hydrolase family protein [Candidatus Hodarchaeales archaeon]|jgi:predicted amidohydrolase
MTPRKLTLALGQVQSIQANVKANLEMMEEICAKAGKENADVVIFPELSVTGYLIHDEIVHLATKIPEGKDIKSLEKIAAENGMYIVTGLPEEGIRGLYYNVAVVIGPDGYVGKQRKILLPNHSVFNERRYFKPSTEINTIDTPVGKLGLCICYDLFSPEIARYHAFNGCDVFICISASPGVRQKFFETFILARAMENSFYTVYVNQAGIQDNLIFWGGSEIVSPNGKRAIKLPYDKPSFGVAEIDLRRIKTNRLFVPTLKDAPEWIYNSLEIATRRL